MGIELLIFTIALIVTSVVGICCGERLKRFLVGRPAVRSRITFRLTLLVWIGSFGSILFCGAVEHPVIFCASVFVMVVLIPVMEAFEPR